jgi:hypothetical protein
LINGRIVERIGAPPLPARVTGPYVEPTMFDVVDRTSGMVTESPMPLVNTLLTV